MSRSSYTITESYSVANRKPTKALPVSYDELDYLKDRISKLRTNINPFLPAGFFVLGVSITCLFQSFYIQSLCLFLVSCACFIFCYLRWKDTESTKADLLTFIELLENKFER